MRRTATRVALVLPLVAALLAGCDDPSSSAAPTAAESELTFVRMSDDAPPLDATEVSFWARRDADREVQIRYTLGGYAGKCLTFRVPAGALLSEDSVLITIRVPDALRFDYEFSPAGLRFSDSHPAELAIRYQWADPDFNSDGVVDERDSEIAGRFGFWKQEQPGQPWTQLQTTRSEATLEAVTHLTGFTRFALASE
jgi:hypothetical protein